MKRPRSAQAQKEPGGKSLSREENAREKALQTPEAFLEYRNNKKVRVDTPRVQQINSVPEIRFVKQRVLAHI